MDAIINSVIEAGTLFVNIFLKVVQFFLRIIGRGQSGPVNQESRERTVRGFVIIALLVLLAIVLVQYRIPELYTLQLRTTILNNLNQISNEDVMSKDDLAPIYNEIVHDFSQRKDFTMDLTFLIPLVSKLIFILSEGLFWWKFLSGAGLGLVLIAWIILARGRAKKERWEAFRGALLIVMIFGIIGATVPLFFKSVEVSILVNFLALAIFQFIMLYIIRRRSHRNRNQLQPS